MNNKAENPHYPALDGLRGIAAYLVLLGHFANYTGFWSEYFSRGTGQFGVMLFFALSGFLMGSIYGNSHLKLLSIKSFYAKRVARVFPLYIFIVIISYISLKVSGDVIFFDINSDNFLKNILFIEGEHILWTVAVEVQFYLVFPIIWAIFYFIKILYAKIFFTLSFVMIIFYFEPESRSMIGHSHYFLLGIIISILPKMNRYLSTFIFILSMIFFFILLPGWPIQYMFVSYEGIWFKYINYIVIFTLVYSSINSSFSNHTIGSKIFRISGDISYSVYLWHVPLIIIFMENMATGLASRSGFIIFFFTISIISYLSFIFIEKPTRRFVISRLM